MCTLNKNKTYTVYRHTSPNGKQYVGITCKPVNDRWQNGKGYSYNKHFSAAIALYGWENFKHEIIAEGLSSDEACEMEKRLIAEGKLTDQEYGYNHSQGGETTLIPSKPIWTEEWKKKFGDLMQDKWRDYNYTKRVVIRKLRNKGVNVPAYLDNTTLSDDWMDYDPTNPEYCGEGICKRVFAAKSERFFRQNYKHCDDQLPLLLCYGLEHDLDNLIYDIDRYDEDLYDENEKFAVINIKEGCGINHYDYVLCPDGRKKKLYSQDDINRLVDEWQEYCDNNWLNGGKKIFDPESKVKFMLDGIANILLRNHMDGIMTEYKEMKIGKYEIPLSACASLFGEEVYSERPLVDNGEARSRVLALMEEAADKFDEAREKKHSKKHREDEALRKKKTFPLTRMQKIEAARKAYNIVKFGFARVDTANEFVYDGIRYRIPASCEAYAPKTTRGGELIYDMDQVICATDASGKLHFFDMNLEPVAIIFPEV